MNRSRIREGATVSLFPFLAVLLCTMGALLVLLVLFGYSANQQDEQVIIEQARQQAAELGIVAENLRWRLEQLTVMRQKSEGDLEALRLQLAGIEEHSRELADELKDLQQLDARLAADAKAAAPDEKKLTELRAELKSARESLDEARRIRDSRPPAYAVIPYEGDSGTHRRPLFIECSLDGVFLQPEGIRLNPDDFDGPPGPGNPLASALRAAREYLARQAIRPEDPALRPYPLLLVRPSGVMAYYAAREAIASWGSDFGYQLINEEWTIAFPKKDLALQDVEMQAINEARQRLAWLAQTRSAGRRVRPEQQQYRASAVRGGIVANGGPTVLGDQSRWDWANQQAARQRIDSADGSGVNNVLERGTGSSSDGASRYGSGGMSKVEAMSRAGRPLAAGTVRGDFGNGKTDVSSSLTSAADWDTSKTNTGENLPGDAIGLSRSASGTNSVGRPGMTTEGSGENAQESAEGTAAGNGNGRGKQYSSAEKENNASGGFASRAATGSGAGGDASGSPYSAGVGGGGTPGGPQIPLGIAVGSQRGAQSGQRRSDSSGQDGSHGCDSLANVRGADWASFATSQRYIPLTRPIQLECASNEIRLLDDDGRRVVVRIPISERTVDSVDLLVAAVRRRVDSWGIAGDRLYWRPELILSETADGAGRRSDLQQLLAGSGLGTRIKNQSNAVEQLPTVRRQRRQASKSDSLRETAEVRK